jgi:EmrB/QacA subfamily drug resistance transporter
MRRGEHDGRRMADGPDVDALRRSGDPADSRPLALDSPAGRWLVVTAVLGSAVTQLEATVVNVALPAIGADLDAGVAGLQWVLNGYLLTLAALILLGGSLGDRLGRRKVFIVGTIVFTAASAVCAVAPSIAVLVIARVIQGAGGALLTPGSLAMLEALLRKEDRARAIGAWSALGGVAGAIGPLVGGWLVDLSWRWVFVLPVPLGVAVVLISLRHLPESRDRTTTGPIDLAGAVLATLALAGVTLALVQADDGPLSLVAAAGLIGIVAAVAFISVERSRPNAMLPPSIFASRQFTAANLLTLVVYAALGGVFFLLVVFLQVVLGYSPLAAGAASLPITVIMLALSARAGALAQRIGPRLPLTVGPLLIAGGMLLMLRIDQASSYVGGVLPAVIVFGLGLAATVAPVTATVLAAVEDEHAGLASGVNNAVARTAQLIAVAVLPLAVGLTDETFADPPAFTDAFHLAMALTAGLSVIGAVIAWTSIRADILEEPPAEPGAPAPVVRQHHTCGIAGPPARPRQVGAAHGG